jgi:Putative transposase/Transposase zinc-binding domain
MSSGVSLGEIVRRIGPRYARSHRLTRPQRRALRAISLCRTPALGGHLDECTHCGYRKMVWHSCRNRHCPRCQAEARKQWLEERKSELLPVPYFHVVFTVPDSLNAFALAGPRQFYDILFAAVRETLLVIARDPRHLGARIGALAVLHTWGQTLTLHPHVHCVIPAGGFSVDGRRWLRARRKKFFLPVRVLGRYFRRRFLEMLRQTLRDDTAFRSRVEHVEDLLVRATSKEWIVYAKRPFGGPEQVLGYLAAYTHRIAISERRLVSFDADRVRFLYKNYRDGDREKVMELDADEFLRRFLSHVLPERFVRIRHFGFLANRVRTRSLALAREQLGESGPAVEPEPHADPSPPQCPQCQIGSMITVETVAPQSVETFDSS